MFDLGIQELIVIFIVALLVFGPKRLPEIGKTLGKGIAEIRKAMHSVKVQMEEEIRDIKSDLPLNTDIYKDIYQAGIEMHDKKQKIEEPPTNEKTEEDINLSKVTDPNRIQEKESYSRKDAKDSYTG